MENKLKDACGFEITEGFYTDNSGFHYYYIKKTPKNIMIKESKDKNYSDLEQSTALNLIRVNRQKDLINLIDSVKKEKSLNYSKKPQHPQKPLNFSRLVKSKKLSLDYLNLKL